jgi:hypothetical protein
MPFSVDPPPGENETECGRCGALVFIELSRCPECGVNLFEPENDLEENHGNHDASAGIFAEIGRFIRQIFGKPYSAEEVFGDALDQSVLYKDLLAKVAGDHHVVERLIEFERQKQPHGSRISWLQNAIRRWERDNRASRSADNR